MIRLGLGRGPRGGTEEGEVVLDRPHDGASWGSAIPPFENREGWDDLNGRMARVDELFAVDAEARRKALNFAARHIRRQEIAKPLLDEIRSKIDAAQSIALPSSALSKACQYAITP
jgi:Transposase IS66 family